MSEDHSALSEMSQDSLKRWPSFSFIVSSLVVQMISLLFGASLYQMTDFTTFILSIIIANIIVFALFCVSGNVGMRMRIPTLTLYGNIFGRLGTKFITVLMLPVGIIWVAWMTRTAAQSVQTVFSGVPFIAIVAVIVLVSVISAAKNIKGMEISGYIQIPVVLVLTLFGCGSLILGNGGVDLAQGVHGQANLFEGVVFVVLTWITFIPFYSDYTRMIKTKKDMVLSTGLSWGILYTLLLICGGIFASVCGANFNLIDSFAKARIPVVLALIIILLCAWTFNDRSLYSYTISINVLFGSSRFVIPALLAGGAVSVGIVWLGLVDQIYVVLNYLGAVFAPLFAVFICRYYALGGLKNGTADFSKMPEFRWEPFIPWGIGVVLGLTVTEYQPLLSFTVSFLLYWAVEKLCYRVRKGAHSNECSVEKHSKII